MKRYAGNQLENERIVIGKERGLPKIGIIFILSVAIPMAIIFAFGPGLYRCLAASEDIRSLSLVPDENMIYRALAGFLTGIIGSLAGLKFLRSEMILHLIRFFLLTFMLVAAAVYIALR